MATVKKAKKKSVVLVKKAGVKKAAVKKVAVKKAIVKKAAVKKVAVKKAIVKKASVKKAIVKKALAKKPLAIESKSVKDTVKIVKSKVAENNESLLKSRMAFKIKNTPAEIIPEKKIKKYKPNKKVKYTAAELKHFRNIILKERKEIIESAKANMASLVDTETGEYKGDNLTYSTHMAEQGTDEMEREKNYLFVQRDEKYLGYLQDALMRIDQGTYGICVECRDEPKNLCRTCPLIQKERLELVPITKHCIECKNLRG